LLRSRGHGVGLRRVNGLEAGNGDGFEVATHNADLNIRLDRGGSACRLGGELLRPPKAEIDVGDCEEDKEGNDNGNDNVQGCVVILNTENYH